MMKKEVNMAIIFNEEKRIFYLQTQNTSYLMCIYRDDYLAHLYYGRKLEENNMIENVLRFEMRAHIMNDDPYDRDFSLEAMPQEYPAFGSGDLNYPAYQIRDINGNYISDARYVSHKIYKGKNKLDGLPATFAKENDSVETLEITLKDYVIGLTIILSYSVFEKYDVITRNACFINDGSDTLHILKAASMSMDMLGDEFDVLHLAGAWARECHLERTPLYRGRFEIGSTRGVSSSQHNPFFALVSKDANEDYGEAYGFSLVYSGNHLIQVEADQYQKVRMSIGINPMCFDWKLEVGKFFQTPECVMTYSAEGIGKMSQQFHKIFRERLCRSKYAEKPRPILVNSWEAFYFDLTEEALVQLARESKEIGIELLVMDDGWFGKRNDDCTSLGDWIVNRDKLPNGIDGLAEKIQKEGMLFGIWVEPEMVSPESELFKKHPEWRLHIPGRKGHQSRNQYVLDLSRDDVCEWLIESVSSILKSGKVSYIKWDMNRQLSEVASAIQMADQQGEIYHRYVLGLYRCLDTLTSKYPDVLFEGCEGGGGRFDAGILHYSPQIWASDDTDAIERLGIQYGYSFVYPWSSVSAHYSAVPNHQVGRITPAKTRAYAAMTGSYGYELNICKLSQEEKEEIKEINRVYAEDCALLAAGNFYRLVSPENNNKASWMVVSEEREEAIVYYFEILNHPNQPFYWLKLKGLDAESFYNVKELDQIYTGAELMYVGIPIPHYKEDFQADSYHVKKVTGCFARKMRSQ